MTPQTGEFDRTRRKIDAGQAVRATIPKLNQPEADTATEVENVFRTSVGREDSRIDFAGKTIFDADAAMLGKETRGSRLETRFAYEERIGVPKAPHVVDRRHASNRQRSENEITTPTHRHLAGVTNEPPPRLHLPIGAETAIARAASSPSRATTVSR